VGKWWQPKTKEKHHGPIEEGKVDPRVRVEVEVLQVFSLACHQALHPGRGQLYEVRETL
jgi:hypothetical protein